MPIKSRTVFSQFSGSRSLGFTTNPDNKGEIRP
jgi:hypothetical protein